MYFQTFFLWQGKAVAKAHAGYSHGNAVKTTMTNFTKSGARKINARK